jgi:hypothetical protein
VCAHHIKCGPLYLLSKQVTEGGEAHTNHFLPRDNAQDLRYLFCTFVAQESSESKNTCVSVI